MMLVAVCQSGDCSYYDRVRRQFTRSNMDIRRVPSTWDLEDIVTFGQQIKVRLCLLLCLYYVILGDTALALDDCLGSCCVFVTFG